jgi:hypothetical protein
MLIVIGILFLLPMLAGQMDVDVNIIGQVMTRAADAMGKAAGLSHPRVLRSADDKNEITIIFDDMDTKKAKEFAASADLKETMMKAGVIGKPTIHFLESI